MEEMFRAYKGFNVDYFKIGQLIKITIQNINGMCIKKDYGFIKYVDRDQLIISSINKDGEGKENTIVPADFFNPEYSMKIEFID